MPRMCFGLRQHDDVRDGLDGRAHRQLGASKDGQLGRYITRPIATCEGGLDFFNIPDREIGYATLWTYTDIRFQIDYI